MSKKFDPYRYLFGEDPAAGSPSTTGRIVFDYERVKWLMGKSKEKVFIVHDEGTYLMSDSEERGPDGLLLLIRPISGGWGAGRGDDFGEQIPLDMLRPDAIVKNPKTLMLEFTPTSFRIVVDGDCIDCGKLLSQHGTRSHNGNEYYVCPKIKKAK